MRTSTKWYILSAIFFAIGIISALGEWVFHWWESPGDIAAPLGFLMGLITLVFGATSGDLENLGTRLDRRFEDLGDRLDKRFEDLGDRLDKRFDDLGDRLDKRFDRLEAGQQELIRGQQEQTRLLRELVDSFQRQREGGAGVG
ncbi:MAG TPA: hypothetical protein VGR28_02165 [Candidatus Thermoplasmatota archaeon]|nr:hypothetical protein [Candidatus Thermoplasmatota archaeon]